MVCKFSKKIVLLVVIMCSLSVRLNAMQPEKKTEGTTGQKTYFAMAQDFTRSFFNGWGPTAGLALGAAWYTIQKDHQAPIKAARWIKDTFTATDDCIKYPATLLGACCLYSYYEPRANSLCTYLYNKFQEIKNSKNNTK